MERVVREDQNPECRMETERHRNSLSLELTIIIVNWNSKDYLRECLLSLKRFPPDIPFEVVVVDSGSFDGCDAMLRTEFPEVQFVQSQANVGFARANNLGFQYSSGKALLLLNPDTELIENSLTVLHQRLMTLPGAGAVGCRLVKGDRSVLSHSVQKFPTVINRAIESEFLRRIFPRSTLWDARALNERLLSEVDGVSGACMMIKRECFAKVGGFSDRYFMYGEDIDLCFRIWGAGFRVYHVPETTVIHHVGGSSGKAKSHFSTVMMRQSCYLFMCEHRGRLAAKAYRAVMGIAALLRMALIPPLLLLGQGVVPEGLESFRKWTAVFRWSIGYSK